MDERIQRALDDDATVVLTPSQRREREQVEALLGAVIRAVPLEPLPDLSAVVMHRIGAAAAESEVPSEPGWRHRARAAVDALLRPRRIVLVLRPVQVLAAALLLLVAAPAVWRAAGPAAPAVAAQVLVEFRLDAPAASAVALAGDFTDWQPVHRMARSEPGVWTVVVPMDPGVHHYAFVVDGEQWVPDPAAPAVSDGFGGLNSRLAVLSPDAGRP